MMSGCEGEISGEKSQVSGRGIEQGRPVGQVGGKSHKITKHQLESLSGWGHREKVNCEI